MTLECHESPIACIHVARDVNGKDYLFVRHEDRCVSVLRDSKPKPSLLATFTATEWLKAITGLYDGKADDGNGSY